MDVSRSVQEAARRKRRRLNWRPEDILFDKQQDVFRSESRYRLLRCGRRSGKSYVWAVALIDAGLKHPKSTPVFVCMSRQDGREIIWPKLEEISDKYDLGLIFNRATGDVTIPQTESVIKIRGAGSMLEINKLRGKAYPVAIVDEAQAFGPDLDYLIDEALEPATADFHGWIGVSGTPNVTRAGPFWEMDMGKHAHAWDHWSWTFLDNPTMPDPKGFIDAVKSRRGWDDNHPSFLREYLGKWIRDDESKAFNVRPHNIVPTFPWDKANDWHWVMGIDVGFHDPFAFVVIAGSQMLGQAYAVDCYQEAEIATLEALTHAERFCAEYPITEIALDTGGAGRLVAEDWKKLSNLPIKGADKTHKHSQVDVMNGDLQSGKLLICRDRCARILGDFEVLEWDSAKMEQQKFVYRKGYADHLADAFQYGYNLCNHHLFDPEVDNRVETGSREYYARLEDKWEEASIQRLQDQETDQDEIWSLLD